MIGAISTRHANIVSIHDHHCCPGASAHACAGLGTDQTPSLSERLNSAYTWVGRTTLTIAVMAILAVVVSACAGQTPQTTVSAAPSATPTASEEASPSSNASAAMGIPEPTEAALTGPPTGDQAATADYNDLVAFISAQPNCEPPQDVPGVPAIGLACDVGLTNLTVTYNADDVVIGVDAYASFQGEAPSAEQLDLAQAIIDATALDLELDFAAFITEALASEEGQEIREVDGYELMASTIESTVLYYRIQPAFIDPLRMIAPDGMDLGPGGRGPGPVAPSDDPGDGD